MKKTDGFTLLELVVGILCAALITGAAMTLLLMGTRTNRSLMAANSEQQTARIITSLVESLASEGSIKTVVTVGKDENGKADWELQDEDGNSILRYSFSDHTIYSRDNTVLMENVTASRAALSDPEDTITGRLLNFSLTTDDNTYQTSVFCRTTNITLDVTEDGDTASDEDDISISISASERDGRFALLEALCTQYGSTGDISGTNIPFSEWYLFHRYDKGYDEYPGDWSENTPWCACFLSWGVFQASSYLNDVPCFASVANWKKYCENIGTWTDSTPLTAQNLTPAAGDLIFFDWVGNDYNGLEHIGVVFYVDNRYVYTIEGNNSDQVELNRYERTSADIKGYGVLDWKTNDQLTP